MTGLEEIIQIWRRHFEDNLKLLRRPNRLHALNSQARTEARVFGNTLATWIDHEAIVRKADMSKRNAARAAYVAASEAPHLAIVSPDDGVAWALNRPAIPGTKQFRVAGRNRGRQRS